MRVRSLLILLVISITIINDYVSFLFNIPLNLDIILSLAMLAIFFLIRSYRFSKENTISNLGIMILVFFVFNFTIILLKYNSYSKYFIAFIGIFYLLQPFLYFSFFKHIRLSLKEIEYIRKTIIIFGIITSCISIAQFIIPGSGEIFNHIFPQPLSKESYTRYSGFFVQSPNRQGLFLLLAYICSRLQYKKITYHSYIFVIGIILTASRINGFLFLIIVFVEITFLPFNKLILYFVAAIPLVFFISTSLLTRFDLLQQNMDAESYFRLYSYNKSIEVLNDNLLFGAGPGFYGGSVAAIFKSPFHEYYGTFHFFLKRLKMPTTIDMFWPHLWAEVGIIGLILYLILVLMIINILVVNLYNYSKFYFFFTLSALIIILFSGFSMLSMEALLTSFNFFMILGLSVNEINILKKSDNAATFNK